MTGRDVFMVAATLALVALTVGAIVGFVAGFVVAGLLR